MHPCSTSQASALALLKLILMIVESRKEEREDEGMHADGVTTTAHTSHNNSRRSFLEGYSLQPAFDAAEEQLHGGRGPEDDENGEEAGQETGPSGERWQCKSFINDSVQGPSGDKAQQRDPRMDQRNRGTSETGWSTGQGDMLGAGGHKEEDAKAGLQTRPALKQHRFRRSEEGSYDSNEQLTELLRREEARAHRDADVDRKLDEIYGLLKTMSETLATGDRQREGAGVRQQSLFSQRMAAPATLSLMTSSADPDSPRQASRAGMMASASKGQVNGIHAIEDRGNGSAGGGGVGADGREGRELVMAGSASEVATNIMKGVLRRSRSRLAGVKSIDPAAASTELATDEGQEES